MEEMILTLVFIALVVLVIMPIVTVILLAGQRKRSRAMWEKLGDLSLNIRGLREELTSLKLELKPSSPEHVEVKKSPQPKASMVVTVESDETKAASDPLAQKLKTAHPKEPPVSVKEAPVAPRPKFPPVVLPSKLIRSPRKSSPVVENAREVLKKIWNWVLVGDRPEGVTFEFALASRWLLIAGIVAIVACVAYFLKWSIERELIGPQARAEPAGVVGVGRVQRVGVDAYAPDDGERAVRRRAVRAAQFGRQRHGCVGIAAHLTVDQVAVAVEGKTLDVAFAGAQAEVERIVVCIQCLADEDRFFSGIGMDNKLGNN